MDGLIEFVVLENGKLTWQPKGTGQKSNENAGGDPCNVDKAHTIDHAHRLVSLEHLAVYQISHFKQIQGLELWDISTCKKKQEMSIPTASEIAFGPNGDLLAASDGFNVTIWNLKTSEVHFSVQGVSFKSPADIFTFNADGSRLLTSTLGRDSVGPDLPYRKYTISVWDSQSGEKILEITPQGEFLKQIIATPDKEIVLARDTLGFNFWNIATGALLANTPSGSYVFDQVNNGIWVTENNEPYPTTLFDYRTGQILKKLTTAYDWVDGMHINYAASRIALMTGDKLTIVDIQSSTRLRTISFDGRFSPDLKGFGADTFSIGLNNEFEIWRYDQDQPIFTLPGKMLYTDGVMVFSQHEGLIQYWDAKTGKFIGQIDTLHNYDESHCLLQSGDFVDISFSTNGYFMATTNADGLICLWGVPKPLPNP